jgi:branched-chain amino acid transport system permease protein
MKGERAWYALVAVLLVIVVWLALNLIESPIGRALRAIHGSEVGAQVVGVDTTRYKVLIFTLSAILASVSGSLWAHYSGFVSPSGVGFIKSIELVTMVVLGGMASTYGAVVGAAVLTVLPEVLTVLHDYEHMVFGGIMMLTMIFMPKGLVPTLAAAFPGRRTKGDDAP